MKIIIAGAGLTGLTYALLLKREGYDVELYEKRPAEDIKNLDSVIFIKSETLKVLSPFIDDDIFAEKSPKAYKEGPRKGIHPKLSVNEDHACINIADLLQSLLDAAAREDIPIYRRYELQSFRRKDDDTATNVEFSGQNGDILNVQCDQLLIACGNRAIKSILGDKYKQPVELHYTNVLGARIPIDHKDFDHANTSAISIYPEFSLPSMIAAQLAAYFFNYNPTSVGSFSVYLASLNMFIMMSTYPPERHDELMLNADNRVNFLRDRIQNMEMGLSHKVPDIKYDWLEEMQNKITADNIGPVSAFSAVLIPEKSLLEQGVVVIGDAFVTTPFIYGSEYNEHVEKAYPRDLVYLNNIKSIISVLEINTANKNNIIDDFIESRWEFILRKDCAGKYRLFASLRGIMKFDKVGHLQIRTQTRLKNAQ